ncbi:MAG: hypothetical protein WBX25_34820 [Rhodomicrobium sp.]
MADDFLTNFGGLPANATPQQVQDAREWAQSFFKPTPPGVSGPYQSYGKFSAIADALRGGMGGYFMRKANEAQLAGLQSGAQVISKAYAPYLPQSPAAGGPGIPPTGNAQASAMQGALSGQGGLGPPQTADQLSARLETGHANPYRGLGSIARDSNGSFSYGNFGLNSQPGNSAWKFAAQYGSQLGLTASPGTEAFNQKWLSLASDPQTAQALRAAESDWYNRNITGPTQQHLNGLLPPQAASDPRVQAFFADRGVQNGVGLDSAAIQQAYQNSGGDNVRFLRNMAQHDLDPNFWQGRFRSAIASGVYGERGNTARVTGRLEGALGMPMQPPGAPITGQGGMARRARRTRPLRGLLLIPQPCRWLPAHLPLAFRLPLPVRPPPA